MLDNLKKKLIFLIIKRNLRKAVFADKNVSLRNANKVGVLALIDSKERMDSIMNFKKTIESYGAKMNVLAFAPFKIVPEYFNTQMQIEAFSNKEVNYFGIPKGRSVQSFLHQEFDLLIDLNLEENISLQYLAGICKSRIKAGKYSDAMKEVYDVMIEAQDEMSYQDFQFSMKNYLSKINTTNA